MDSEKRNQYELVKSEQALLEERITRIVEATENIAFMEERDDEKIMAKINRDLAKVLGDDYGGVSSPSKKTALKSQEEADLANPAYLAWSLTQYIRNSILVGLPFPPNSLV
jgi:hypothetical protein